MRKYELSQFKPMMLHILRATNECINQIMRVSLDKLTHNQTSQILVTAFYVSQRRSELRQIIYGRGSGIDLWKRPTLILLNTFLLSPTDYCNHQFQSGSFCNIHICSLASIWVNQQKKLWQQCWLNQLWRRVTVIFSIAAKTESTIMAWIIVETNKV